MIQKRTCDEFRKTGLLLFINQILHIFGWAIVVDTDYNEMYPARTSWRGFSEEDVSEAYLDVTKYMKRNYAELMREMEVEDADDK